MECETKICRICLKRIANSMQYFLLKGSIAEKLLNILPQADLNYVSDAVVCTHCRDMIKASYEFKVVCLRAENVVKELREMELPFYEVESFIGSDDTIIKLEIDESFIIENEIEVANDYDKKENVEIGSNNLPTDSENHQGIKEDAYNYECTRLLRSASAMHKASHKRDKLLCCSYCSFRSSDSRQFKKHAQKHTEKKSYKCKHCDFKTLYNPSLRRHELRHSDPLFKCQHCSYGAIREEHYKNHIQKHKMNGIQLS
ncbi:hypothetical protein FQA39_LY16655 [Lamprigera yunnana]|nr:hypothetical protein FQA39_LY16655 [Lamprigera yunnana]